MAAIYANNMKENAMQKDALTYLRFVNQKKRKTYYGCTEILHFQVNYCTILPSIIMLKVIVSTMIRTRTSWTLC